jgi:CDP-diacylglycerol--glycerol-3-phosphate 3-phosphatidyltransferase
MRNPPLQLVHNDSRGASRVNLPNSITMGRILCIPVLIWMLSPRFPHGSWHGEQEVIASIFFILLSISDGVDGYLARLRGQITTMGMLLDPLADKLLITSAYVALVEFNPHVVKAWIVIVVIGREFLVSGLRSIASTEGFTIEASDVGKLKTVIQIVSVVAAILDHGWYSWHIGWFVVPVDLFAVVGIYYTAAVSIISAIDYFVAFWRKIDKATATRRTRDNEYVLSRRQKKNNAAAAAHNVTQP